CRVTQSGSQSGASLHRLVAEHVDHRALDVDVRLGHFGDEVGALHVILDAHARLGRVAELDLVLLELERASPGGEAHAASTGDAGEPDRGAAVSLAQDEHAHAAARAAGVGAAALALGPHVVSPAWQS